MLVVENITVKFGGVTALQGVSTTVDPGVVTALLGPNGSGKTTMANVVSGFCRPTSGHLTWKGQEITRWSTRRRVAVGLGRSFQTAEVFGSLTVKENLELARRSGHSLSQQEVVAVLASLGVDKLSEVRAGALSYGQRRSLAIAMVAQLRPGLLILDEPTSGLSHHERLRLRELVSELRSFDIGVWLIDHDMEFVRATCEEAMVLDAGVEIARGKLTDVLKDQAVVNAYLGASDVA
jgi:ABC-type branched-subunit amino acid transport system ATPase component